MKAKNGHFAWEVLEKLELTVVGVGDCGGKTAISCERGGTTTKGPTLGVFTFLRENEHSARIFERGGLVVVGGPQQ